METKEKDEVMEEIEIIDDFDDIVSTPKEEPIFADHNIAEEYLKPNAEESVPAMTPLQEELRQEILHQVEAKQEENVLEKIEPIVEEKQKAETVVSPESMIEETKVLLEKQTPVVKEDVKLETVMKEPEIIPEKTEVTIDEDLVNASLENTMLLNKELLKAAAAESVKETKDTAKENKKGIIFIVIIFVCLIIFTALIPFILKMTGQ